MEIFFFWLIASIIVAVAAAARGRTGFGWFVLSLIISPLLSLILVLVLPSLAGDKVGQTLRSDSGELITTRTHIRCPTCKELIRADASKCRFCGEALVPQILDAR